MRTATYDTLVLGAIFAIVLGATHASGCEEVADTDVPVRTVAVHVANDTDGTVHLYEVDAAGREELVEKIPAGELATLVTEPHRQWVLRRDGSVLREFAATDATQQVLELSVPPTALAAQ